MENRTQEAPATIPTPRADIAVEMKEVESTQLSKIGYDVPTSTLAVEFKPKEDESAGSLYHYAGCTPEQFAAFQAAPSAGSYFHNNIKGKVDLFPFVKVRAGVKKSEARAA